MNFLVVFALVLLTNAQNYDEPSLRNVSEHQLQQKPGEYKGFRNAAIVADAPQCATVAKNILQRGGNIADAAIAGMLCMGVVHPHSSGIGGGFVLVHYSPRSKVASVLCAREKASQSSKEDMFDKLPANSSNVGGLAVAVPGEIKGFHELYKRFGGQMPWSKLFQPTIEMLENGIRVDSHMAFALNSSKDYILKDPNLKDIFANKATGKVWVEGDRYRNQALVQTLKIIAADGAETFYNPNSPLGSKIVQDLQKYGSIIKSQDLTAYNVDWQESIRHRYDHGYTLHTAGPPSTGAALIFILRILNHYRSMIRANDLRTSQILIEAFKHTFGRLSNFGDPTDPANKVQIAEHVREFIESEAYLRKVTDKIKFDSTNNTREYYQDESDRSTRDSGTAHLSIATPNGDAISVTTTIGRFFGAKVLSRQTGVVFNNKMNNFETNPRMRVKYPANKIGPGKRPTSATSPSIHVDPNGVVKLVLGAAGGDKIVPALASVILNKLFLQMTLFNSIAAYRIHHQLVPMEVEYEPHYNRQIIDGLKRIGHVVKETRPAACVIGITRQEYNSLWGCLDSRKPGSVDGY